MVDCKKRMKIHKKLLPVKATYFFTLAGVGSLLPYLSVYMKQVGLSASESAIIYGVMPFLGALIKPVLGACADKLQRHKAFLMLCCIATGVLHAGLLFVPHSQQDTSDASSYVAVACREQAWYIEGCHQQRKQNCSLEKPVRTNETCFVTCAAIESEKFNCKNESCRNMTTETELVFNTTHEMIYESMCADSPLSDINGLILQCSNLTKFHCSVQCQETSLKNAMCSKNSSNMERYGPVFFMFFTIYLFAQIAFAPIFNLIDAMLYVYLGEDRNKWGQQRLWGTVGYAVFAVISTLYMDIFGSAEKKNYTAAFIMFALNNLIASICVCMFKISSDVSCSNMLQHLFSILRIPRLACLLVVVFIFGMYQGLIETFLYWHLHTLGSSQLLFGLCTVMNCIPEVIVFSFAGRILRFLGHVPTMSIVFVAWFVRLLSYSFLTNPWYVLAIEPLHSITFGLMYAGASSYGSKVAPPGMHGTIQGLLSGLHFGFGKGVGSVSSGHVFEHFGSAVMFRSFAVSAVVFLLLFLLVSLLIRHFAEDTQQHKESEDMVKTVATKEEKPEKDGAEESMLKGQPA